MNWYNRESNGSQKGVKRPRKSPGTLENKGDVEKNEIRNRRAPECREKYIV